MDGADAIKYIVKNRIPGAVVECGVQTGKYEHIWIHELMYQGKTRDIYMYDTFAGLTAPGEYDYTTDHGVYKMTKDEVLNKWNSRKIDDTTNEWCYTPLEKVKDFLNSTGYPQHKLHYIVGDVMQTLQNPANIPDEIAILRLDTDWYESSKFELEKMYDNVVDGGLVIFDDYYHWDGQRRATDEFFESRGIVCDFIKKNNQTATIIKNRKYVRPVNHISWLRR